MQTSKHILSSGINKSSLPEVNNTELWHIRLGHIDVKHLTQSIRNGLIPDITIEPYPTCESCIQGKMTKAPFYGVGHHATNLLELVYSDVCHLRLLIMVIYTSLPLPMISNVMVIFI